MVSQYALELAKNNRIELNNVSTIATAAMIPWLSEKTLEGLESLDFSLRNEFVDFIAPYTNLAAQIGQDYYNDLRLLAQLETGLEYPEFTPVISDLRDTINRSYAASGKAGKDVGNGTIDNLTKLSVVAGAIVTKNIFSSMRESFGDYGRNDSALRIIVRVPAPGACAWCLLLADEASHTNKSHDWCRCTIGSTFKGESKTKFTQEENSLFMDRYDSVYAELNADDNYGTAEDVMAVLRVKYGYK